MNQSYLAKNRLQCVSNRGIWSTSVTNSHKRKRLKPDAVPTVFDRTPIKLPSLVQPEPGSGRLSRKMSSTSSSLFADTTTKKIRTAYEKREI